MLLILLSIIREIMNCVQKPVIINKIIKNQRIVFFNYENSSFENLTFKKINFYLKIMTNKNKELKIPDILFQKEANIKLEMVHKYLCSEAK